MDPRAAPLLKSWPGVEVGRTRQSGRAQAEAVFAREKRKDMSVISCHPVPSDLWDPTHLFGEERA
jgi:hypothetical protein